MTIQEVFEKLGRDKRRALVPFAMGGYPDMLGFERTLSLICRYGDIVEVGVPFSDPVADGPTIQAAASQSIEKGAKIGDILDVVARVTGDKSTPPIVLMIAANQVLAYGAERLLQRGVSCGVQGIIIPDMPTEESGEIRAFCEEYGVNFVPLVAPTTPRERCTTIADCARGFLYAVAVRGVTGARQEYGNDTSDFLKRLRCLSDVPVCVGFGVASSRQVEQLYDHVDGFVVASALIREMDETGSCESLLKELRRACDGKTVLN